VTRRFPLAGLLRLRALEEEQASAELARARREETRARERAVETAQRLGDAALPAHGDVHAWRAAVAGRAALGALLVEHRVELSAAGGVVMQRSGEWSAAQQRLRTLERLEERHDEAERRAEARVEQNVLDEVAGRRAPGAPTAPGHGTAPAGHGSATTVHGTAPAGHGSAEVTR